MKSTIHYYRDMVVGNGVSYAYDDLLLQDIINICNEFNMVAEFDGDEQRVHFYEADEER